MKPFISKHYLWFCGGNFVLHVCFIIWNAWEHKAWLTGMWTGFLIANLIALFAQREAEAFHQGIKWFINKLEKTEHEFYPIQESPQA